MPGADARCHRNGWMRHRNVFQVDRADPLAARLDDVLAAVGDLHETVRIDRRHIAGWEPTVHKRIAAFALEIAGDDPRPADHELPCGLTVVRKVTAVVIHDLDVHAKRSAALLGLHGHAPFYAEAGVLGFQRADRAEWAHLGHAPGMQHLYRV